MFHYFYFCWGGGSAFAAKYTVIDLGKLGGTYSIARGINNYAEVVGVSETGNGTQLHAFYLADYKWVMNDLGTLSNGYVSEAYAINNNHEIVGQSYIQGSTILHAILYKNSQIIDIGGLTAFGSQAFAINDKSQIVGQSCMASNCSPLHGFIYNNGVMTDLGTLGGQQTIPIGINNSGKVVGQSFDSSNNSRAFIYSNGVISDLGVVGQSRARAINDSDQIVGDTAISGGLSAAFLYDKGTTTMLSSLPGFTNSIALGINKNGVIVGAAFSTTAFSGHAFIYENGALKDINDLIPNDQGWVLSEARSINDFGAIAGTGTLNGERHAFKLVLTPVITSLAPASAPIGSVICINGTNFCNPHPLYPTSFCTTKFNSRIGVVKFGTRFAFPGTVNVFPDSVCVTVPEDLGFGAAQTAPIEVITPYSSVFGPVFTVQ